MPAEIVVPELGESVLEATIGRWLKQEGDQVAQGEAVVELETDKVNLEVSATTSGVLSKLERQEGEDVQVGDVLGIIDEAGSPPAPEKEEPQPEPAESEPEKTAAPEREPAVAGEDRYTPVAARLAREQGVDLSEVRGTGPGGRVTRSDVEAHLKQAAPAPQPEAQPSAAPEAKPSPQQERPVSAQAAGERQKPAPAQPQPVEQDGAGRSEERVRMSRRRRTIASRLVEAQQTAAMLSTFNEVDMSAVMDLRTRRNPGFQERHDIKLGFTSFFVKAAVSALKAYPRLNAELQGDEMVLKHYYDIGIAVGDPEGLVVPVIRDADRLSFAEIERQVKTFAQKAQQGSLSLADLQGGTFSITNGGVFGSLLSTPILSYPQVGILGLHKIEKRPVAVDDQVEIRSMMYVALTYDHRIVDGREAVQFLVRVKELIEDPENLLLEG
jgi:2-oxoglutarate dehydrogenase E2 component (dihydrolipoamide succinyltransferase)